MSPVMTDEEAREADRARVGDDAVERRAVTIPTTPTAAPADAPRASTRGVYLDLENRRRIVAAGDVVPDGWRRVETAVLSDRVGETPTNFEDGVTEGGAPASSSSSSSPRSTPTSSSEPDEFDKLSGDALDKAVEEAGIDATKGGSKQDGGLTAPEKRDALRAKARE